MNISNRENWQLTKIARFFLTSISYQGNFYYKRGNLYVFMQGIFPECQVYKFRPFANICTSGTVFQRYFTKRGRKCLTKEVNLHICLYSKHAFLNLTCVHFCLLNIILFVYSLLVKFHTNTLIRYCHTFFQHEIINKQQ